MIVSPAAGRFARIIGSSPILRRRRFEVVASRYVMPLDDEDGWAAGGFSRHV
jgi:hypothetical protein